MNTKTYRGESVLSGGDPGFLGRACFLRSSDSESPLRLFFLETALISGTPTGPMPASVEAMNAAILSGGTACIFCC